MDSRGVWEIIIGILGLVGSGLFNSWLVTYRIGKMRGTETAKTTELVKAMARLDKEQDRQLNQNLRVFQAIEELRRRVGNGDRDWLSLTGG